MAHFQPHTKRVAEKSEMEHLLITTGPNLPGLRILGYGTWHLRERRVVKELKPLPVAPTVSTWAHADLEHFWQDIMIRSGVVTVLTSWDESP